MQGEFYANELPASCMLDRLMVELHCIDLLGKVRFSAFYTDSIAHSQITKIQLHGSYGGFFEIPDN